MTVSICPILAIHSRFWQSHKAYTFAYHLIVALPAGFRKAMEVGPRFPATSGKKTRGGYLISEKKGSTTITCYPHGGIKMFKKPEVDVGRSKLESHGSEQRALPSTGTRTPATIGPTIQIKGDVLVTGNQGVHIDGRVDGSITLSDNILSVGTLGQINATIDGRAIFVAGKVDGDLTGSEQVVVKSSGSVHGNIMAPRVTLEDGCKFKGSIDMDAESRVAPASDNSTRNKKVADISATSGGSGELSSGGALGKSPRP